jgi:hypothetical protein
MRSAECRQEFPRQSRSEVQSRERDDKMVEAHLEEEVFTSTTQLAPTACRERREIGRQTHRSLFLKQVLL